MYFSITPKKTKIVINTINLNCYYFNRKCQHAPDLQISITIPKILNISVNGQSDHRLSRTRTTPYA